MIEDVDNVQKILEDYGTIGMSLYSPVIGECTLVRVFGDDYGIRVKAASNGENYVFDDKGQYLGVLHGTYDVPASAFDVDDAECTLFPDRTQRSWQVFVEEAKKTANSYIRQSMVRNLENVPSYVLEGNKVQTTVLELCYGFRHVAYLNKRKYDNVDLHVDPKDTVEGYCKYINNSSCSRHPMDIHHIRLWAPELLCYIDESRLFRPFEKVITAVFLKKEETARWLPVQYAFYNPKDRSHVLFGTNVQTLNGNCELRSAYVNQSRIIPILPYKGNEHLVFKEVEDFHVKNG